MTPAVVVVGSLNADLILDVERLPAAGETVAGRSITYSPGGKGANQAVAAALLGAEVALVGAVGEDAAAATAVRGLTAAGVSSVDQFTVPGPTGLAVVAVDAHGENSIVVVPGANAALDAARVESARDVIAAAEILLVQGEIPVEGSTRAVELARGRVVVNLAPVVALPRTVLTRADPLVVNAQEAAGAAALLGVSAPASDPCTRAQQLVAAGCRSVVLTLGGQGAVVAQPERDAVRIAAVETTVVDTTGAVDACVGALAVALLEGDDLVTAVRRAMSVAAYSVGRRGARGSYPTAAEVDW